MNRLSLSSSAIKSAGYEAATNMLEIEFQNGEVRQYESVPVTVFQNLMVAASHGNYFNSFIKYQYNYRAEAVPQLQKRKSDPGLLSW